MEQPVLSGCGGDSHEPAITRVGLGEEGGDSGGGGIPDPTNVDVEQSVEVVCGSLPLLLAADDNPGRGHDCMKPPEGSNGRVDRTVERVTITNISGEGEYLVGPATLERVEL